MMPLLSRESRIRCRVGAALLVLASLLASPGATGEEPAPVARSSRREWRSDDEISRLFRDLAPVPRGTPEGVDPDDEIIELEPYIVQGDTTLLLASIRRDLDLGPETIRQRVAEMAPVLNQRAELTARATGRFFAETPAGSPADRPSTFYVNNVQIVDMGRKFGDVLEDLLNRDGRD